MSFDVSLMIPACTHCGSDARQVYEFNLTHNINKVVDECLSAGGVSPRDAEHDWAWWRVENWLARDLVEPLQLALNHLDTNRARFVKMEPSNKWGTVADLERVMREFKSACETHPNATASVSG